MSKEKDWILTVNLARVLLGILLLVFRADVVFAAGGGMALVFVDVSAALFRHAHPLLSRLLARIVVVAYLTFLLNFLAGLHILSSMDDFVLGVLMGGIIALTAFNLLILVRLFFPPFSRSDELPDWAKRVWGRVSWLVLPALLLPGILLGFVVVRGADQRWVGDVMVLLEAGMQLTFASVVGILALKGLPAGIDEPSLLQPIRNVIRLMPVWLVLGSVLEVFRGMWAVWIMSAATIVVTMTWVYRLIAGRSNERGFITRSVE